MDGGGRERQERGGGCGERAHPCCKVLMKLFQAVWETGGIKGSEADSELN